MGSTNYACPSSGFTIQINHSNDEKLTQIARDILEDRYLLPNEKIQEGFARACCAFADNAEHAQRLYTYVSNEWFMFATPLLANGGTEKGLPISCFLNYVDDSLRGLANNLEENIFLSSGGGGIGSYFGAIRSKGTEISRCQGGTSPGVIPFLKTVDSQMLAYHQSGTRRGSTAIYLDVSHPEITEFIEMRKPSGGDANRKCLNLHHGVNITDDFMNAVEAGELWNLVDPHTKQITDTVPARRLWDRILEIRMETGEPYLHFIDTANRALPQSLKDKGLRINSSNLCQEIELPTAPDRTAVCCLSSVNLAKWDEWQGDAQFIRDMLSMLDNALEVFIRKAPPELRRAVRSACSERSIGLGALGFHSLLQSKMIPFESNRAKELNERIFKFMNEVAQEFNLVLGAQKGEAPDMQGTGKRFSHMFAIAPNASSGLIAGVSPGVEPLRANAYSQKTLSGTHSIRNRYLRGVLRKYGQDRDDIWASIAKNHGSVQHLPFLSELEKAVFKTAIEVDQEAIVDLAAQRQRYICQGQSINLFFPPQTKMSFLRKVHKKAWQNGIKGLYYLRSEAIGRTNSELVREEQADPIAAAQTGPEEPKYKIECVGCDG